MKLKVVSRLKTFSGQRERSLSDFGGYVGKPVPCTPTFLGCFLLRDNFYLLSEDEKKSLRRSRL